MDRINGRTSPIINATPADLPPPPMPGAGKTTKTPRKAGRPPDAALRARRRTQILEAATAIFADQGFARADVQAIADRVEVGKGTVYRYFPTKETLFLAAVDYGMRCLKEADGNYAAAATLFGPSRQSVQQYANSSLRDDRWKPYQQNRRRKRASN